MAILRGGRRIGNYDIRLGLPRDKSLDNVGSDARIGTIAGPTGDPIIDTAEARIASAARGAKSAKIQRGTDYTKGDKNKGKLNKESTMGRLLAQVAQGEGFSLSHKYLIQIFLPKALNPAINGEGGELTTPDFVRNVSMMCSSLMLPSRDINTTAFNTYGPARNMPYAYSFPGTIEMTFYADKYMRQRQFFEMWQNQLFNKDTHNMKYYDDYIGHVDIYQLGTRVFQPAPPVQDTQTITEVTYAVRLYEVFPETIGEVEMAYATNNTVTQLPITLNFRYWENLTMSNIGRTLVGSFDPNTPTNLDVGPGLGNEGDFIPTSQIVSVSPLDLGTKNLMGSQQSQGGFFSKLPPELKRVGRDIINQAKRDLPIGRITGGRIFPPFL